MAAPLKSLLRQGTSPCSGSFASGPEALSPPLTSHAYREARLKLCLEHSPGDYKLDVDLDTALACLPLFSANTNFFIFPIFYLGFSPLSDLRIIKNDCARDTPLTCIHCQIPHSVNSLVRDSGIV